MKKTLFATISILLMLFAFVACEGSPSQGPSGGDLTESEAITLAGTYLGSINFSQLIVDAFDDTITTIDATSLSKDGFTIEFDKYAGEALTKTIVTTPAAKADATNDSATGTDDTESEEETVTITEITSGTIEFTFTTANSKTTYTAKTADDDPIVFKGAPEGTDLAFEITGEATITFSTGTDDAITGLASESTVKIGAPDATKSTISVGGTSVDYEDIKESAKNGFDKTVTVPGDEEETKFTKEEAVTAVSSIVDALSRDNLTKDLMQGINNVMGNGEYTDIKNVSFEGLAIINNGTKYDFNTDTKKFLNAENEEFQLSSIATIKDISQLAIELKAGFSGYKKAFKTTTASTDSRSITDGSIVATVYPGKLTESGTLNGIYTLATDDLKIDFDGESYTLKISDLAGSFENLSLSALLGQGTKANSDFVLYTPYKEDSSSKIAVTVEDGTQTISWANLSLEENTNYAKELAALTDAKYFYQHFGSLRFLSSLYAAFTNPEETTAVKITDYSKDGGIAFDAEETTENQEEAAEKSFTLNIKFTNYNYYKEDTYQTVSGDVSITFAGTVSESTKFTANSFSVEEATLDVKDSSTDATTKRPDAKATIKGNGTFGSSNGSIEFVVSNNKITGIKQYIDKDPTEENQNQIKYDQDTHEFAITDGVESIAIKLAENN